ncbi:MAG TPA: fibronectin type III domain-containing protein [Pseudonocardiaceae bacterium]|nr:fibronectin type III domain-containing protein [Pseudonocardiaceae bacterium]
MRRILTLLTVLLVAGLTACSGARPAASLTATLVDPTDIRLDWPGAPPGALGQLVEYANQPSGKFVTLDFLPAGAKTYLHPRLMPQTAFYYRVVPIFGRETAPVSATITPTAPTPPDGDWATPRSAPQPSVARYSLRGSAKAGPADLRAQPAGPTGILLRWTDHADDEAGYLVQVNSRVAAVLAPGINQFGLYPLPAEHVAAYRIAAFYYGQPSPVVHQTTGGSA